MQTRRVDAMVMVYKCEVDGCGKYRCAHPGPPGPCPHCGSVACQHTGTIDATAWVAHLLNSRGAGRRRHIASIVL